MAPQAIGEKSMGRHKWDTYAAMSHEVQAECASVTSRTDLNNQKPFVITHGFAFLDYEMGSV